MNTSRPLESKSTAEVRKIFTDSTDKTKQEEALEEMKLRRIELERLNGSPAGGYHCYDSNEWISHHFPHFGFVIL